VRIKNPFLRQKTYDIGRQLLPQGIDTRLSPKWQVSHPAKAEKVTATKFDDCIAESFRDMFDDSVVPG